MKTLLSIAAALLASNTSAADWQSDVRFTAEPAPSITPFNYKCVAASGHVVHAVWYDERDGNFEVYYKRSSDAGTNWSVDTRLTKDSATSWFSSIAVAGLDVHVVWMDDRDGNFEIYYKHSPDEGITWSGDTRLTNDSAPSQFPSVAVSGSIVNVIWQDARDGNKEIYSKRSANAGLRWGDDTRLTNDAADSIFASVSASDLSVNVAWEEYRDGNPEIYHKHSIDGGIRWSEDTRLTQDAAVSFSPSIWVAGSDVHVVWYDTRDGNAEIYYKRSADGGFVWHIDTRLTNDSAGSLHVCVTAAGPNAHIVWYDERDGNSEIYYKLSTDSGLTWSADTRLTNEAGESIRPAIALAGPVVHVVWEDTRDGNEEIYYKRNPAGNADVADFDGDGSVGPADLAQLLAQWGPCERECAADLTGDSAVGPADLAQLLAHWS